MHSFLGHDPRLDAWLHVEANTLRVAQLVEDALVVYRPTLRFYYRCNDCLLPMTFDTKKEAVDCPACNGTLEYLGAVQRHRVVGVRYDIPCDARCTGASGPHCDCPCGGENHGSGRLVERDVDRGAVRTVMSTAELAKHRAFGKTWREGVRRVRDLLASARPGLRSYATIKLRDAKKLRTIKGREAALAKIVADLEAPR